MLWITCFCYHTLHVRRLNPRLVKRLTQACKWRRQNPNPASLMPVPMLLFTSLYLGAGGRGPGPSLAHVITHWVVLAKCFACLGPPPPNIVIMLVLHMEPSAVLQRTQAAASFHFQVWAENAPSRTTWSRKMNCSHASEGGVWAPVLWLSEFQSLALTATQLEVNIYWMVHTMPVRSLANSATCWLSDLEKQ